MTGRRELVVTNERENQTIDRNPAQPRLHQRAAETQAYGTVNHLLPTELEETVRLEITAQLNQLLADDLHPPIWFHVVGLHTGMRYF